MFSDFGKYIIGIFLLLFVFPAVAMSEETQASVSDVDDGSVWKVTRSWDDSEEQRYSTWVHDMVDADFFVRHKLVTDCADVAYGLRFIYARMRGLPQGAHDKQGNVFGNWSKRFSELSRGKTWNSDTRFLRALQFVTLEFTLARCLPQDTHPIKIWPEHGFLRPGTIFVNKRHAGIMLEVDRSSFFPLKCGYSTLPPKVRSLILVNYEEQLTYDDIGLGLVNWNWWQKNSASGKWEIVADENMAGFSEEQYDFPTNLALALQRRYSLVDDNPQMALDELMRSLRSALDLRSDVVWQGYRNYVGREKDRSRSSWRYDQYSTPGRDARIRGKFFDMRQLVKQRVFDEDLLIDRLLHEKINARGIAPMSFLEFRHAMQMDKVGFDPWLDVKDRWGLDDYQLLWYRPFPDRVERLAFDSEQRIFGYNPEQEISLKAVSMQDHAVATEGQWYDLFRQAQRSLRALRLQYGLVADAPAPLRLADDGMLIAGLQGDLICYETSGAVRWRKKISSHLYADIVQGPEGQIYLPTEKGMLLALSAESGQTLWQMDLGRRAIYPVVVAGSGNVYLAAEELLIALTPTGDKRWQQTLDDVAYSAPAVGPDERVYIGALDRKLHAFDKNGLVLWKFPVPSTFLIPPLVSADGRTVYALSNNKTIYAIATRPDSADQ